MRAVLAVSMLPLLGCSSLLGIENPSSGDDGPADAGKMDAPPSGDHLEFTISDFSLLQRGRRRVGVKLIRQAGGSEDVTATATYSSDNAALVGVSSPGVVDSLAAQAGEALITASYPAVVAATIKVTVKPALCHPVINEMSTSGSSGASDEFVEIYNPCATSIDVASWTLVYRGPNTAGANDDRLLTTVVTTVAPATSLLAGEFRFYVGNSYSGPGTPAAKWTDAQGIIGAQGGGVGLRSGPKDSVGTLVDSVAYGNASETALYPFTETKALAIVAQGYSAARKPYDGKDDDNGPMDFAIGTALTPGTTNAP